MCPSCFRETRLGNSSHDVCYLKRSIAVIGGVVIKLVAALRTCPINVDTLLRCCFFPNGSGVCVGFVLFGISVCLRRWCLLHSLSLGSSLHLFFCFVVRHLTYVSVPRYWEKYFSRILLRSGAIPLLLFRSRAAPCHIRHACSLFCRFSRVLPVFVVTASFRCVLLPFLRALFSCLLRATSIIRVFDVRSVFGHTLKIIGGGR